MKVKLIKEHNGKAVGTELDCTNDRANYLIRVGVAELVKEQKEEKRAYKTKELK